MQEGGSILPKGKIRSKLGWLTVFRVCLIGVEPSAEAELKRAKGERAHMVTSPIVVSHCVKCCTMLRTKSDECGRWNILLVLQHITVDVACSQRHQPHV
jgi:hypothetical protein